MPFHDRLTHFFGVGQLALRTTDGRASPTLIPSTRSGKGRIPCIAAVEPSDKEVWDFVVYVQTMMHRYEFAIANSLRS